MKDPILDYQQFIDYFSETDQFNSSKIVVMHSYLATLLHTVDKLDRPILVKLPLMQFIFLN